MSTSGQKVDLELQAIGTLLSALEPLSDEACKNIIMYVFQRLGMEFAPQDPRSATPPMSVAAASHAAGLEAEAATAIDIRSFKEEKLPRTASEMVAVAAYYLAHLAPPGERRDHIVADDIRRCFLQASFPLPSAPPHITLVKAADAGYVDARERGQYRLNPVGYNLVTNTLPRTQALLERRPAISHKKGGPPRTKPRT